jgi:transcriptional regulator with XRE-family HTH domain
VSKELGDKIKSIRLKRGLDTGDMAEELNMLVTSYNKIERTGITTVKTLNKIAGILEVHLSDFFVSEAKESLNDKIGFVTRDEMNAAIEKSSRETKELLQSEFEKLYKLLKQGAKKNNHKKK